VVETLYASVEQSFTAQGTFEKPSKPRVGRKPLFKSKGLLFQGNIGVVLRLKYVWSIGGMILTGKI
jgi:hypothetical protein